MYYELINVSYFMMDFLQAVADKYIILKRFFFIFKNEFDTFNGSKILINYFITFRSIHLDPIF